MAAPRSTYLFNYMPVDKGGAAMWTSYDGPTYGADLQLGKNLGFNTVRTPIPADNAAFNYPTPTSGQLANLVDFYNRVKALGLKWHMPLFDLFGLYGQVTGSKTFAAAVLGALPDHTALACVELQNETPFSSATTYSASFDAGYTGVTSPAPTIGAAAVVWAKAMVPYLRTVTTKPVTMSSRGIGNTTNGLLDLAAYFQAVNGTTAAPDWYDFHAYSYNNSPHNTFDALQQAIAVVGDPAKLFIGEAGCSSTVSGNSQSAQQGQQLQADYLQALRWSAAQLGLNDPGVWTLFDITGGSGSWSAGQQFGLYDSTKTLKTAGKLYQSAPLGSGSRALGVDWYTHTPTTDAAGNTFPKRWAIYRGSGATQPVTVAVDTGTVLTKRPAVIISGSGASDNANNPPALIRDFGSGFPLIRPGVPVTVEAWLKKDSGTVGSVNLQLAWYSSTGFLSSVNGSTLTLGTSFAKYTITGTPPATAVSLRFLVNVPRTSGQVWVTDVRTTAAARMLRTPTGWRRRPNVVVTPPPPVTDHLTAFYAARVGFAKNTTAGFGTYDTFTVSNTSGTSVQDTTTSGSLAWCLAQPSSNKRIVFATGLTGNISIPNHGSINGCDNVLLDGYNFTGKILGRLDFSGCTNCTVMYLTVEQPFQYGTDPSGPCIGMGDARNFYIFRCNTWNTGDVTIATGRYDDTIPSPSYGTIHLCRVGPNPGPYSMQAPIVSAPINAGFTDVGTWSSSNSGYAANTTLIGPDGKRYWTAQAIAASSTFSTDPAVGWQRPGLPSSVDNDRWNGKGMNSAYNHNYIDGSGKTVSFSFTDATHFTLAASGTANYGNGFTSVMGTGISAGTDLEGRPYTLVDATHGVLTSGTYTGTMGATLSDGQIYKPASPPHPDRFQFFDKSAFVTMYMNVLQGNHLRNGKCRSQIVDFVSNLTAKHGTLTDVGGSLHLGGGYSMEDDGLGVHEGNVYVPKIPGEELLGWRNSDADAAGITPHLAVASDGGNTKAIVSDGKASQAPSVSDPNKGGNLYVSANNYFNGLGTDSMYYNTGFDRTSNTLWSAASGVINGYTLTIPDVSTYSGAQTLVTLLEDNTATRAGNPSSPVRSWRDVHTGSTGQFPNP